MTQTTELKRGQIWYPSIGGKERQIDQFEVLNCDPRYPSGTVLVWWTHRLGESGACTDRSFKAWIRKMNARLK